MEKTSTNTLLPTFSLAGLIGFLLFHGIFKWVSIAQDFSSVFDFFFGSSSERRLEKKNIKNDMPISTWEKEEESQEDDGKLSREDIGMVMREMKLNYNREGKNLEQRLGLDDLLVMFEEKEPEIEEVKAAFDIIDKNKDGYIDTTELQSLLCSLGFREGSVMEDCERMIRAFDENRDGRIDFNEFVTLMENSFC